MTQTRNDIINSYREKVKLANKELTKKELFKDLLHRLYAGEKQIAKIIDAISAGAEKTVINIPRKDKLHKGSADTLYNKIIIEFENDLKITYKHAKEQLAGYLLGQFNSGEGYNYTLIASDFIHWKVVVPDGDGIDIHPLSVQIAKTTMLVSLGKDVIKANKPIHINIILANTLLAPEGVKNLFGGEFLMQIDKDKYYLNTQVFEDVHLFDEALDVCEILADDTQGQKPETLKVFENILRKQYSNGGLNDKLIASFYQIYTGLKKVKEKGKDSIWKFIVQNLYKPYFLNGKFDYVIGNPPWFTFNAIKNEEYQNILQEIAEKYDVKPLRVASMPQMEIAAIFLVYCTNYFLNEKGKLAFVLPRSFFSADQHSNTRSGRAKGLKIYSIWDLEDVTPLFNMRSCVLFTEKATLKRTIPPTGVAGKAFSGKVPGHNCNWEAAKAKISEEDVNWLYAVQGKSSALTTRKFKNQSKINPYQALFKNGATVYPRPFYFVELNQELPPDFRNRIINVRTSDSIKPDAKLPWKTLDFKSQVESDFLFRTILSKSIFPFAVCNPNLTVLPLIISSDKRGNKTIHLSNSLELRKRGYLKAAKWFENVENIWNIHKTEKNKDITAENYLNWQSKIVNQNLNFRYLVLYNVSGKDAHASIIDRTNFDFEIIFDYSTFGLYAHSLNEAYYLTAILNSAIPNEMMKDFQAKGLFGVRHISKRILDVYFPKFDENDKIHLQLVGLSKTAHQKAKIYLRQNPPKQELTAIHLGRIRVDIKKHLAEEMKAIDALVKKVIG